MITSQRTATPQQSEHLKEETGVNKNATWDWEKCPELTVTTVPIVEEKPEAIVEKPAAEKKENENVYTSRFDDENIWQNISRSIERLDLDWAKMPPLPKLTPSTSTIPAMTTTASGSKYQKCHCQTNNVTSNYRKNTTETCRCRGSTKTIPTTTTTKNSANLPDFKKYGNPITATAYAKIHRNNTLHSSQTHLPQPLKPTSAYHQHNYTHDFTLDMHHQSPSYRCSHSHDTNLDLDPQTTNTPHTPLVETTTSANTAEELCHSSNRLSHTPRRKCHHHRHHSHHDHQQRSHSRCHSHDRGMAYLSSSSGREDASKTEPLTWLQQHLVLKQTIKACHKCQTTDHGEVSIETDHRSRPATADREPDLQLTTCCHTQHIIRACCDNKECLKDLATTKPKDEQEKGTNTEENFSKEDKPKQPFKVDVNVRLVPKSSRSKEELREKKVMAEEIPVAGPIESSEPQTTTTPASDENELYLDLDTSETEATKL